MNMYMVPFFVEIVPLSIVVVHGPVAAVHPLWCSLPTHGPPPVIIPPYYYHHTA